MGSLSTSDSTNSDWHKLEPTASILLPNDVSSSDLFGGDMFGDELIDMYSSSTTGETISPPPGKSEKTETSEASASVTTPEVVPSGATQESSEGLGSFNGMHDLSITPSSISRSPPPGLIEDPLSQTTLISPVAEQQVGTLDQSISLGSVKRGIDEENRTAANNISSQKKSKQPRLSLHSYKRFVKKLSGAVVPASMLPKGKGVQVSQLGVIQRQPASMNSKMSRIQSTPNPLGLAAAPTVARVVSLGQLPGDILSSNSSYVVESKANAIMTSDRIGTGRSNLVETLSQDSATATAAAIVSSTPKNASDFTAAAQAAVSNLILSAGVSTAHKAAAVMVTSSDSSVVTKDFLATIDNNASKVNNDTNAASACSNGLTSVNWVNNMNHNTNTAMNISHESYPSSSNQLYHSNHSNSAPSVPVIRNSVTVQATTNKGTAIAATAAANKQRCNNNRGRQNLTPDERAKQNRDRNREHARNTRLRKKAYVEELKRTLTEMVSQRDALELERRQEKQRELEQREVRFRVMQEFLLMRGLNEQSKERWEAILENGFVMTMPLTSMYREINKKSSTPTSDPQEKEGTSVNDNSKISSKGKVPCAETSTSHEKPATITSSSIDVNGFSLENTLNGVNDVMLDSASLADCLEKTYGNSTTVYLSHQCDRNKFLMDGCVGVLDWNASTELSRSSLNQDNFTKLFFRGTMRAKFCSASNKIISAHLFFDTGAVFQELQRIDIGERTVSPTLVTSSTQNLNVREEGQDVENTNNTQGVDATAAAEADAILDSLQMPFFPGGSSTQHDAQPASVTSSEKSDSETEEENLVDMILS